MGPNDQPSRATLTVGDWRVLGDRLEIRCAKVTRKLEPMTMRLLLLLAEQHPRTISRDEIVDRLWAGRAVTDDAINKQISKLRSALDLGRGEEPYLVTVPRVGVRLARDVGRADEHAGLASRRSRLWFAGAVAALLLAGAGVWAIARPVQWELVQDPVTALPGTEIEPALSPDGEWLAYVARSGPSERFGLFVRRSDSETARRITPAAIHARAPSWSGDGRIAFVARSPAGCRIAVGLPSGSIRFVASCVSAEIGGLAWLGRDRLIVSDHPRAGASFRLDTVDLGTGRRSQLVDPPQGDVGDLHPVVSADRRTVYFLRNKSVGPREVFAARIGRPGAEAISADGAPINGLALGPQGSLLVSSARGGHGFSLWQLDPRRREWRRLMPEAAPGIASRGDGRLATYARIERQVSLWQLPLDDPQAEGRPLAASTRMDWSPVLSPDGKRLAFLSNRTGEWQIWLLDLSTSRADRLTDFDGAEIQDISWSRDGGMIATAVASQGLFDLHLIDVRSRTSRKIAVTPRDERQPVFAPDGSSLWFVRRSGSRFQLRSIELITQAEQPVLDGVMRALPSPDGRFAFFAKPFTDGLWRADLRSRSVIRLAPWPDVSRMRNVDVRGDRVWATAAQPDGSFALMAIAGSAAPVLTRRIPELARPSGIAVGDGTVIYARLRREESDLVTLHLQKRR